MSDRSDIIDGKDAVNARRGLTYTKKCGWIDLGHARPDGARFLWQRILYEMNDGGAPTGYFRVSYRQMMRKQAVGVGIRKRYDVKKGLNRHEKQSVALAIFMDVSHRFEGLQANWLFRKFTNSGYSAEDLVSNLIGFYRALSPSKDFIGLCEPVSQAIAFGIWDKYGAVGANKNYSTVPYIYPIPPSEDGAMSMPLPPGLNTIRPAKQGVLFKEVR